MDTKFAKPKAVSEELPKTVYCIRHERTVKAEQGANGLRHAEGDWMEEVEFCFFPDGWEACPPPTNLPDDWAAQELDDDQKAELELAELEGVGERLEGLGTE